MKIKIYETYSFNTPIIQNNILTPIQSGRKIAPDRLDMIGDDTGENISHKNPTYCEVTSQYWVWKHDTTSDYIGHMHYRRHLILDDSIHHEGNHKKYRGTSIATLDTFGDDYVEKYGLTQSHIEKIIPQYDIILPKPEDVKQEYSSTSVGDHFGRRMDLNVPMLEVVHVLDTLYPEYKEDYETIIKRTALHSRNIFVMKRAIFHEYNALVFSILEKVEKRLGISTYTEHKERYKENKAHWRLNQDYLIPSTRAVRSRVMGYMAELVLNTYIQHLKRTKKDIKIREFQLTEVMNTPIAPVIAKPIEDADEPATIPIAMVVSEEYCIGIAATLQSLKEHASAMYRYKIYIFGKDLEGRTRQLLYEMIQDTKNITLHFLNITMLYTAFPEKITANNEHSALMLHQLVLHKFFPQYSKLISLDSDMVLLDDVAKLYNMDMGDTYIAAVPDDSRHTGNLINHIQKKVGISLVNYVNTGIIVWNLKKIRNDGKEDFYVDLLQYKDKVLVAGQCLLNIGFRDHIFYLPLAWNLRALLLADKPTYAPLQWNSTKGMSVDNALELIAHYQEARTNPKIVHYIGKLKPWLYPQAIGAHYYWQYIEKTPFYSWACDTSYNFIFESYRTQESQKIQETQEKKYLSLFKKRKNIKGSRYTLLGIPIFRIKKKQSYAKIYVLSIPLWRRGYKNNRH